MPEASVPATLGLLNAKRRARLVIASAALIAVGALSLLVTLRLKPAGAAGEGTHLRIHSPATGSFQPALAGLTLYIILAGLALRIDRVEFEVEVMLSRFVGVDRAAESLGAGGTDPSTPCRVSRGMMRGIVRPNLRPLSFAPNASPACTPAACDRWSQLVRWRPGGGSARRPSRNPKHSISWKKTIIGLESCLG